MAALLVFTLSSLEMLKEKDCLRRGVLYFGCKVIKKSSSNINIFLTLASNRICIKKDIFQKLMIK